MSDKKIKISKEFQAGSLPALVECGDLRLIAVNADGTMPWKAYKDEIKSAAQDLLQEHGGVLFRGFAGDQSDSRFCNEFAKMFADELLTYEFASTPRTDLGDGVYTATEYPSHQIIPLHNEQSYTLQWPLNIWFHCVTAPKEGGETPIADSRKIYNAMPVEIRQRFESKKLLYVRNYGNGLDLSWEQVFNTDSKGQVEEYCRKNNINFKWKEDGELRTWQRCQATAQHHTTKDWFWFNEHTVKFPWQKGDFLMLDNMLAAHGRSTFSGERKVVVAMANGYNSTQSN